MVFILHQLQKKCREQNKGLCATFAALTQSAGKVHGGFLGVLAVPENSPTWCFNCTKQGCVPAPTLFSIFFSMMLKHATQDLDDEDCVYVSTTWTAVCSIYGARTPTPRPRKGRPQMTLPLLPTQNELCSKSKPPLQMLLSSLALRLASRRQRSFTSPCPRKNTTRPPSPSATQS